MGSDVGRGYHFILALDLGDLRVGLHNGSNNVRKRRIALVFYLFFFLRIFRKPCPSITFQLLALPKLRYHLGDDVAR